MQWQYLSEGACFTDPSYAYLGKLQGQGRRVFSGQSALDLEKTLLSCRRLPTPGHIGDHVASGALQAPDLRRSRNALFRRLVLSQARTPAASSRQALAALDA